jgi:DeoR/GlpR family transcriptional regulator of sugar metabolism
LGQRKLVPIAPIDRVDVLITDSLADKGILKILEDKGIEVLIGEVGD